jgi:hypothetical protein
MGTIMIKFFLTLILLIPILCQARLINKCGTYYAEGYYTEVESPLHNGQKKKVILLERGTNSEIRFFISNPEFQKLIPNSHLGVNFKLKLTFESSCFYACEGRIAEVIEPIDPFQEPKSFLYPRPSPIKNTEVLCKPNSFEDIERAPSEVKIKPKVNKN